MLTQDQINQAISDAVPDVLTGLRKEISETALYHARNSVQAAVTKAVGEWVEAELVPEIRATLAAEKGPEYVYSHKLVEILEDGDVNDAPSIAFATHISVYRRKAGEVTDEWVYDIPIPGALSFLLDSLVTVVKHFNSFHSLEKNGFSGGAMMAERERA